jgi:CheY-like chemotaxis protein
MSARRIKVLVAEDEVLVRLMLADALREQGFQVFEATNADEALSILRSMTVDVVVTNLNMRGATDGMLVAGYVRERCPGAALLLSSAQAPPIAKDCPFDAFFVKPYDPLSVATWILRRDPSRLGHEDRGVA